MTSQQPQPGVLSPEDLAQFDSLSVSPPAQPQPQPTPQQEAVSSATDTSNPNKYGSYLVGAPDTASAFASRNPQAPKNPYNPFLQPQQEQVPPASQPRPQSTLASLREREDGDAQPSMVSSSSVPSAPPAAAAAAAPPTTSMPPTARPKAWATKDIIYQGQERKIIMQNENGPCSLLAIANILLLRGDVALSPPDRPLVDYDYLSSLIAEYLLTRPETFSQGEGVLDKALALLPQTQHGLNLNPSFLSNDAFLDGGSGNAQQLALFKLLGIKLYHGFVPDSSSPVEYELVRMAGSYDAAVDQVVRGEEVTATFFTDALGESNVSAALKELKRRGGYAIVDSSGWGTALQKRTIEQALTISDFLDDNASQLTYPGLFALSALPEGTLAALFRFNHLSVLYRPNAVAPTPDAIAMANTTPDMPPSLLTLITDEVFLDDELAVWETLADVDGRDSGDIYDSRLRRRPAGRSRHEPAINGNGIAPTPGEDADYALALQLHSEERERADAQRRRYESRQQQQNRPRHAYRHRGFDGPNDTGNGNTTSTGADPGAADTSSRSGGGLKGFLSSIGLGKKNKAKKGDAGQAGVPSAGGNPSN